MTAFFWVMAVLAIYPYLIYPPLIALASRLFGQERIPAPAGWDALRVSLLVAAHNEAEVIADWVKDALAQESVESDLEVVVASDGSTDSTVEIAGRSADQRLRVFDYPDRRGKATVLNESIPRLRGDVVILSDANTRFDPTVARSLLRWFDRPEVGVVCGRLVLIDARTGRNADGLYWKFETFLKRHEARLGALLGANGAIYAIRRSVFTPIPGGTIIDDFVIPLIAKVRTGCEILYDPETTAVEETAPDLSAEFRRRARIGAGGFQSLGQLWPLLSPRWGWLTFAFVSHKLLRWFGPFFLIGAFAANLLLLDRTAYQILLGFQVAAYSMAWLEPWLPAGSGPVRLVRLAAMFTSMNAALFVGFCRWATGRQNATWQPTARSADFGAGSLP